ncbi:PREDICTED: olfactory receptor 52B2-like [Sturnus vulgaris]|uniref:olfactory receptor 52B2-like n=1 Tax=Sturnus vulgaris TaxID=9172 RepID=UPI00071A99DB|nr:PREDICTED: olfactory receptor 52B2-like [Sturnus vulgaris]
MSNVSSLAPDTFILTGIPGMEQLHVWISVPFCCLYLAAVLANGALLLTVWAEPSLHQPMYLLLCLLALADLTLSTTAVPRALALFWFRAGEISFGACLTQMFFLHFACLVESVILLAMAFDRFVAICFPLRYGAVLSVRAVARAGLAAVLRGLGAILPCVLLLRRLRFCGPRAIAHTYCEHMAIARLACADVRADAWYGLLLPFALGALDLLLIAVSYAFILLAVCRLPSRPARSKALHTCGSHLCVLLLFYVPAAFAALAQRFGRGIAPDVHIVLANLYVLLPPLLNPIVYGVRTRQIRDRALKVFTGPGSRVLRPPARG